MAVLPTATVPAIISTQVLPSDLHDIADTILSAYGDERLYGLIEGPPATRAAYPIRVDRFARRWGQLLDSPHLLFIKATSIDPSTGKERVVGFACAHRPSTPEVRNLQMRQALGVDLSEEDQEAWKGVDVNMWDGFLESYDAVRMKLMEGRKHWYIGPVAVHPAFGGRGIGRALLQPVIDLADQEGDCIYLETSPAGQRLYEKAGWVSILKEDGGSGKEMLRLPFGKAVVKEV